MALIAACSYSENGIHYVDPIPGEPPTFHVSTNLDTLMTIKVADSFYIAYDVEIVNGKFYQLDAYAFDNIIFASDSTSDSFWIFRDTLVEPAVDTLLMYFYYSTNSNSLADIVEIEFNVFDLKFPISYIEGEEP